MRMKRAASFGMLGASFAALLCAACRESPPPPPPKEVVVWKRLGAWSGRGNTQTESFLGLTGSLRVQWKTQNESAGRKGTFRLTLQSAISGRARMLQMIRS